MKGKKWLRSLGLLVAGIVLGIGGTWVVQRAQAKPAPAYQIVVGPTRQRTVKYASGDGGRYSFPNPDRQLSVVVKHGDTFALYRLTAK